MYFRCLIIFLWVILLSIGCSRSSVAEPFFEECEKLSSELKRIQEIPIEIIKNKVVKSGEIYNVEKYDYTKRSDYIKANYANIINMIEKLKTTATDPIDTLSDDAEFVELVSYLTISYPKAPTLKIFEEKTVKYIKSTRAIQLDPRTIKCFSDIWTFKFFTSTEFWEESGQDVVVKLIKSSDYKSIFIQTLIKVVYLDNGDYLKAQSAFKKHESELGPEHREYLERFIQDAEDYIKKYNDLQ